MDDGFAMGYAMGQDSGGNRSGCNDSGFGGANSWIWIIVVFALLFGWGRNGDQSGSGGGGSMAAYVPYLASAVGTSGAVTRADLCSEFAFNDLNRAVEGVNNGLCNGFYTTSTQMLNGFNGVDNAICSMGYNNAQLANGINTTLMQGFNSANVVALQNQNALQAQISECCCDNKAALADLKYTIASEDCATRQLIQTGFRDSIEATNASTRAILDYLCSEKIADLQNENQGLKLAASQQAQNTYLTNFITAQNQQLRAQVAPTPVPSYSVPAPYPYCVGTGYSVYGSGSCGCNTGCGC